MLLLWDLGMVVLMVGFGVDDGFVFSIEFEGGMSNVNGFVNLIGIYNY